MSALHEQKREKTREVAEAKRKQEELDKAQMDYTIAKDEEWKQREQKKKDERKQHAQKLMTESNQKYLQMQQAAQNGGNRGQKMTTEERRYNRELLKEVIKIKKEGQLDDIFERCTSKKVTSYE